MKKKTFKELAKSCPAVMDNDTDYPDECGIRYITYKDEYEYCQEDTCPIYHFVKQLMDKYDEPKQ